MISGIRNMGAKTAFNCCYSFVQHHFMGETSNSMVYVHTCRGNEADFDRTNTKLYES